MEFEEMPTNNGETLHDRYRREHEADIRHLKAVITDMVERISYADGQAYYDDKRKIDELKARLVELEKSHD